MYKYATGFSAAMSISQQIINEGQPAVDRYLKFLKAAARLSIELLKIANVDMSTTEPVNNIKLFAQPAGPDGALYRPITHRYDSYIFDIVISIWRVYNESNERGYTSTVLINKK